MLPGCLLRCARHRIAKELAYTKGKHPEGWNMNGDNYNRRTHRNLTRAAVVTAALASLAVVGPQAAGVAAADTTPACSNVEIVFARGTNEAPGVGVTGQAFVDALEADLPGQTVDVYGVNYPASLSFERRGTGRRRHDKPGRGDRGDVPQHEDCARRLLAGRGGGRIHGDRRRPIRIFASPRHHRTDARIGGRSHCRRCPVRHTTAVHPRIAGPRSATDRRRRGLYGEDTPAVRPGRSGLLARRSGPGGA